jgi:REP element-mobilizing transposase RayT
VVQAFQPAFNTMDFQDPRKLPFTPLHCRGELPHLYKPGAHHFVTFRLADAIVSPNDRRPPAPSNDEYTPQSILSSYDPPLTLGTCALKDPRIATLVQDALLHVNNQRYLLIAWCIMPNHVHVVFVPYSHHPLDEILQSWKGYTARCANQILGRKGPFWERESFDHLIRNQQYLVNFVRYVEVNPVDAGLCATPKDWPYSSVGVEYRRGT